MKKLLKKTQKRQFIQENPFSPLTFKDRIATLYAQHPEAAADVTS